MNISIHIRYRHPNVCIPNYEYHNTSALDLLGCTMPNVIPTLPINDGTKYRLYALNNSENDIGLFSDNINGVYISSIGPKY